MIQCTIDGAPAYLFHCAPDGRSPVRMTFDMPANVERSLSGREIRRASASVPRVTTQFGITLQGQDAVDLKANLRASKLERVGLPAWPFMTSWSNPTPKVSAGLWVAWREGWAEWEIYEAGSFPDETPYDWIAPLLVGRLSGRNVEWHSSNLLTMQVEHVESSPAEFGLQILDPGTSVVGPSPSEAYDLPPTVLPSLVDLQRRGQSVRIGIDREQVGLGRQPVEVNHDDPADEFSQSSMSGTSGDVHLLLHHWQCHAAGRPFWARSWVSDLALSEDAAGDVIEVEPGLGALPGDWLAIEKPAAPPQFVRVVDVDGLEVTLSAPVSNAPAAHTLISRLVLARFFRPSITIEFLASDLVRFTAPVVEVVEEYSPAPGETLGQTIGETCPTVWLYEVQSASGVERFTSHEADVVIGETVWTSRRIQHGEIRQGIRLDRDEVSVTVAAGDSIILDRVARGEEQGNVRVVVRSARIAAPCGCPNQPPIDTGGGGGGGGGGGRPVPIYDPLFETAMPPRDVDLDADESLGEPFPMASAFVFGWDASVLGTDPNEEIDLEVIQCAQASLEAEILATHGPDHVVGPMKWVWDPSTGPRPSMFIRHQRLNPPWNDPPLPCSTLDPSLVVSVTYAGTMAIAAQVYPPAT